MKKEINSRTFVSVIAVAALIVAGLLWWSYKAPSAPSANGPVKPKMDRAVPTADEMKQIQEWKKQHPDAYTKY